MDEESTTNKKQKLNFVVWKGTNGRKDLVIDRGDHRVVQDILSNAFENVNYPRTKKTVRSRDEWKLDKGHRMVKVQNGGERRVTTLKFTAGQTGPRLRFHSLPSSIGLLQSLKKLDISIKSLTTLPDELGNLKNLVFLNLASSNIATLPTSIGQLKNLETLNLSSTTKLSHLPEKIGDLSNLTLLDLNFSSITMFPASIGNLSNLTLLDLNYSGITMLPASIGQLKNLKQLGLLNTKKLSYLPEEIGNLSNLTGLGLSYSGITMLPASIGNLSNLAHLHLYFSGITMLPASIGNLKNLEHLDLSYIKKLSHLPEEIGNLSNLKFLDLQGSEITMLPASIGNLKNLQTLNLDFTKSISSLPEEIGSLVNLNELHAYGSKIQSLPATIAKLTKLTRINMSRSNLDALPKSLKCLEGPLTLSVDSTPLSKNTARLLSVFPCSLGAVGYFTERDGPEILRHALACNRARFRLGATYGRKRVLWSMPTLWPYVLTNTTRIFQVYPNTSSPKYYDYKIQDLDAVYQMLSIERESFVGVLKMRQDAN